MRHDVQLRTVARLADHTHFDVGKYEVNVRKGPYPYYGELFERFMVDDYGVDAPAVLFVSAVGKVLNADGGFRTALEHGRCGSNAFAHVVVPRDSADAAYLRACLETLPDAADYIAGANNLQTLDELAVLRIALPWPCRAARDAYAAAVERADARVARAHGDLRAARDRLKEAERVAAAADGEALAGLRAELAAADAAHDAAREARAVLVNDFMEFGVLDGCDCAPTELACPAGLPSYSDARAARARAEVRERARREAAGRGGVPVGPALHGALGLLAAVAETRAFGLGAADLAWELAPLAAVRACAAPDAWGALARAASDGGPAGVPGALDAALAQLAASDPCFELLPNLSYASSLLSGEQLAAWVGMLDGVDAASITPANLRAVFDLAAGAAAVPAEATGLVAGLLRVWARPGRTVYLPFADHTGLGDAASAGAPGCALRAQCSDNAALLELLMVRGVANARGGAKAPVEACAPGASALLDDRYAGDPAQLAVVDALSEPQPWSPVPPRRDDPRWVLGAPTRMRSPYARVQQGLAHLAPDGRLVALVPTFELQTSASGDEANRRALVEQGRVQAVVALPPRIWGDGRVPTSLLVAGARGSARSCLMVDASDLGVGEDEALFGPDPQRVFAPGAADRVAAALRAWFDADGPAVDLDRDRRAAAFEQPGFSRAVALDEVARGGCLLAPWLYTRP